jgi:hypothetical protein
MQHVHTRPKGRNDYSRMATEVATYPEQENPPQSWKTVENLKCLQVYALDMVYI